MITEVLEVAPDGTGDPEIYARAVNYLRAGGLVAFPTETVYGLGADVTHPEAVASIYEVKGRPADNPLIVHVSDLEHATIFCEEVDARMKLLAEAFWPGPLTLVCEARPDYRQAASGGLKTVALRVPGHPVALRLIRESGLGLAAPSANRSGRPSPTLAAHVLKDLGGKIPLVLNGGPCQVGIESTVVDLSGKKVRILRPGQIDAAALSKVLGQQVTLAAPESAKRHSPGTRYRHYKPSAPVWVLEQGVDEGVWQTMLGALADSGLRWGYAGWRDVSGGMPAALENLSKDPDDYGKCFYSALRSLDERSVDLILIDGPAANTGMTMALSDRLQRAAEGQIASLEMLAKALRRNNPPGA